MFSDYENHRKVAKKFLVERDYKAAIDSFSKSLNQLAIETSYLSLVEEETSRPFKFKIPVEAASMLIFIALCYMKIGEPEKALRIFEEIDKIQDFLKNKKSSLGVSQVEELDDLFDTISHSKKSISVKSLSNQQTQEGVELLKADPNFQQVCSNTASILKFSSSSASSSNNCFIATAAYGTSEHEDLDTFRQFRDLKLLPNYFGARVVSIYYSIGPTLSSWIRKSPLLQKVLRNFLEKLASWMRSHFK